MEKYGKIWSAINFHMEKISHFYRSGFARRYHRILNVLSCCPNLAQSNFEENFRMKCFARIDKLFMVFVSKLSNTLIHCIKFISIDVNYQYMQDPWYWHFTMSLLTYCRSTVASSHSGSLRTNCSLVRSVVGAISHTIVGLSQYVIIRVINMKLSQKLDTVLGQL